MNDVYSFRQGDSPLLISIPHDGRELAPGMAERMTADGLDLPDTDWHVRRLYEFSGELGAGILAARFSRYVADLNRADSDDALYAGKVSTGLCPVSTFSGMPIYNTGDECRDDEVPGRVTQYWYPYHNRIAAELDRLRKKFGYALLWDAHSIPGEVPLLFDGILPDLNIGTFDGASCDNRLQQAVTCSATASGYDSIVNGRFKGGFITRHHGDPQVGVHAVQLELAQRSYMNELDRQYDVDDARILTETLRSMLSDFLRSAEKHLR